MEDYQRFYIYGIMFWICRIEFYGISFQDQFLAVNPGIPTFTYQRAGNS